MPPLKNTLRKNTLILTLVLAFAVLGGACATTAMWDKKSYNTQNYTESVGSFLVSGDQKHIVVLGVKHHYVFNFDDRLKKLLASPLRARLKADFGTFVVYADSARVNGSAKLYIPASQLSEQDKQLARSLGLYPATLKDGQMIHQFTHTMYGQYYAAGKFSLPSNMRYLNSTYKVNISYRTPSNKNVPLKILATPITLAADGALAILGIPLLIIAGAN